MTLVGAVKHDLSRLHRTWMEFIFPRQLDPSPVLGRHKPENPAGKLGYWLWGSIGAPVVAILYPLLLIGVLLRVYTRRFNRLATSLGATGTTVVVAVLWGLLAVALSTQYSLTGTIAVVAAGGVAAISALLSILTSRVGGRSVDVLVSYPFSVTAVFLPPVVAALYSPTVANIVFPKSETLAIWILDTLLVVGGLNTVIRSQFQLAGVSYVGMWVALAVPVGWILGALVTLADVIRPKEPR